MSVTVSNPTSNLSGKEIVLTAGTHTVTGLWTFDRDPSAPFAVTSGSAVVTNLDADKLDGLDSIAFYRNPATAALDLSSASAGQIVFPGTQVPSANVNTLDDYEEGTWTPVIGGSGGTAGQAYTTQVGYYQKVGKRVTVDFNVVLSNAGTITGTPQIQGLPFASQTVSNYKAVGVLGWTNMTGTNWSSMRCFIASNVSVLSLEGNTSATTSSATAPAAADIAATTEFRGTISYMCAA